MEAVKPILAEHGLSLVVSDAIIEVGGRVYVEARAELNDGGNIVAISKASAREPLAKKGMDEAQITGATSSYARKYALNGLFAIDDTKDADATNDHKPAPKITQAEAIEKLGQAVDYKSMLAEHGKLPVDMQQNEDILAFCKQRKLEFTPTDK